MRDETSPGGRRTIDGYHLADEGSDQLRPGEDAKGAAEALAHTLNCSVAIVEKLFFGDEEVDASVIGVFGPMTEAEYQIKTSGVVYEPGELIV